MAKAITYAEEARGDACEYAGVLQPSRVKKKKVEESPKAAAVTPKGSSVRARLGAFLGRALGPIRTGRDARGEANKDAKILLLQQHCPHCTQQAM